MPKGVLRSHVTALGPWLQSSLWCEGRVGLEVLLLLNIAVMDTQQDAAGLQDPHCLSKKWSTMLPPQHHNSCLISSFSFFPVLFYSGLAGHVRVPAKYLLNRDYDLSVILHTHLLTVIFCLDSGTYFFNLL